MWRTPESISSPDRAQCSVECRHTGSARSRSRRTIIMVSRIRELPVEGQRARPFARNRLGRYSLVPVRTVSVSCHYSILHTLLISHRLPSCTASPCPPTGFRTQCSSFVCTRRPQAQTPPQHFPVANALGSHSPFSLLDYPSPFI